MTDFKVIARFKLQDNSDCRLITKHAGICDYYAIERKSKDLLGAERWVSYEDSDRTSRFYAIAEAIANNRFYLVEGDVCKQRSLSELQRKGSYDKEDVDLTSDGMGIPPTDVRWKDLTEDGIMMDNNTRYRIKIGQRFPKIHIEECTAGARYAWRAAEENVDSLYMLLSNMTWLARSYMDTASILEGKLKVATDEVLRLTRQQLEASEETKATAHVPVGAADEDIANVLRLVSVMASRLISIDEQLPTLLKNTNQLLIDHEFHRIERAQEAYVWEETLLEKLTSIETALAKKRK